MSITMYQASVPQFIRMLGNLKGILEKAAAHAAAKKIDESALLNARLFPDMFPLTRQVQIATDFARGTGARLSGVEPPAVEDKETELRRTGGARRRGDRLPAHAAGREDRRRGSARDQAQDPRRRRGPSPASITCSSIALPNFYFHLTTAYAILRHNGIEIGKGDFVGAFAWNHAPGAAP